MLSQAKMGQQEAAQGRPAQESSSPENSFDSQQDWRRRRRYCEEEEKLCCGLSQGEVISSCFRWDFCHEVSADLHHKLIYGYWKKEKNKKTQTWPLNEKTALSNQLP